MNDEAPLLSRRDGDLVRSLSSTFVVIIHCTSLWVRDFYARHDFLSPGFLITILDQMSRFTVPAFFFLSGYGLARQYLARPEPIGAFYRRRLVKIALPFFAWSALTFYRPLGRILAMPWQDDPGRALAGFLELLLLRGFDYQYYFLIIIFQFYLLFPFVVRLARRRWFVLACLLLQLALLSPVEGYLALAGRRLPPLYSFLVAFYLFYCVAGVHAAWHRDLCARLLARFTSFQVFAFWAGALALTVAEYWVNISVLRKPLAYADHFNRWAVVLYCFASFLLLLKHRDGIIARLHAAPRWQFFYVLVTPFSFFVYLAHTHFLRLADLFLRGQHPLLIPARVIFVLGLSYLAAWSLQAVLRNQPALRQVLGLPKAGVTRRDFQPAMTPRPAE